MSGIRLLTPGTPAFAALQWFGTFTGVAGALILALNIPVSGWGWVLFAVSAAAWTAAGFAIRDYSLVVLQGAFLVVDLIGIWRWLIL